MKGFILALLLATGLPVAAPERLPLAGAPGRFQLVQAVVLIRSIGTNQIGQITAGAIYQTNLFKVDTATGETWTWEEQYGPRLADTVRGWLPVPLEIPDTRYSKEKRK